MKFPGEREDFDHSWNFISFTYSFTEKKANAFVRYFSKKTKKVKSVQNKMTSL